MRGHGRGGGSRKVCSALHYFIFHCFASSDLLSPPLPLLVSISLEVACTNYLIFVSDE